MAERQLKFEHEVRNAVSGVALEVKHIKEAMERIEAHLKRMDKACSDCDDDEWYAHYE